MGHTLRRFTPFLAVLFLLTALPARSQTPTTFGYQGRLAEANLPSNGSFDFEFRLFDATVGGAMIGVQQKLNIPVANGAFTVPLDFGPAAFTGPPRYLEVSVRPSGGGGFILLLPRQPVLSAPYAIRALNAAQADSANNANQLGGVAAGQFVKTDDPRLAGGGGNAVLNQTAVQAGANFNIDGTGTANLFNALTEYDLAGGRILGMGPGDSLNLYVGVGAGASATSNLGVNTFVGASAGKANTFGSGNSFFGVFSGLVNTTGRDNAFFGVFSGNDNLTGSGNSFFGSQAGFLTTTGNNNVFSGYGAGYGNVTGSKNVFVGSTTGSKNNSASNNTIVGGFAGENNTSTGESYFGYNAGMNNTTGSGNSFFGNSTGLANTIGTSNSFFGSGSGQANTTGVENAYFGASSGRATTTGGANAFFGTFAGIVNLTGSFNDFFGHFAGKLNTSGEFNAFFGDAAGQNNTTGSKNAFFGPVTGSGNKGGSYVTLLGTLADVGADNLTHATAIGAEAVVNASNTVVLGRAADAVRVPGSLAVSGTVSGNGSGLTNLTPANLSAGTASINITGNAATATDSTKLGGVAAAQYVKTDDPRLGGGGGGSGILNQTTPQVGANFNIGGNGVIGGNLTVNGTITASNFPGGGGGTQASGKTFFGSNAGISDTTGISNAFFGELAGGANSTGNGNSFFGQSAGVENTTGNSNAFFGDHAGWHNSTASLNAFFGSSSGESNTTGQTNAFFGSSSGQLNTTGNGNSFFGAGSGDNTTTGSDNTFLGQAAGGGNGTGAYNVFVGFGAGQKNQIGKYNTILGYTSDLGSDGLSFATALGAGVTVNTSNTVVIGRAADTVSIPGKLNVAGTVSKGGGSFKIDHPLDPANKYLYHSFVESPDMKNVYDGVVTTDSNGFATVTLPDYFEALNRDFRYQLTCIGQFAQAIVSEEVRDNRFAIQTDKPNVKVSWQVTGIRHDTFANAHRIPVEEDKPEAERSGYLHSEAAETSVRQ